MKRSQNALTCLRGMELNLLHFQIICIKCFNPNCIKLFNIDSFNTFLTSPVKRNKIVDAMNVCFSSSITGNKYKFLGVRLRYLPRSIKSWSGSQLFAPKVLPKGYPAPDCNLWLCRKLVKFNIC